MEMKRKFRSWLRRCIPAVIGLFEPRDRRGKWFEEKYYTYLFTRNLHYSKAAPNEEEARRWEHIRILVDKALEISGKAMFDQIVDFGCGRGWLVQALMPYGKVTGIEPVKKVVEHGKKLYPGIDIRPGGLEMLPALKPDLIVSSEVIEHLGHANLPVYFARFHQVLADGGWLLVTTPRKEGYAAWSGYVDLDQPTEEWLSEDEVRAFGERAGFRVVAKQVYSASPVPMAPMLEIYQQWLFRK